jgi:hypothetical protein
MGSRVVAVSRHGERWSVIAQVTESGGRVGVRRIAVIDAPSRVSRIARTAACSTLSLNLWPM